MASKQDVKNHSLWNITPQDPDLSHLSPWVSFVVLVNTYTCVQFCQNKHAAYTCMLTMAAFHCESADNTVLYISNDTAGAMDGIEHYS